MKYALVEKLNPKAIHGIFESLDRAERHLRDTVPEYVRKGYFVDKSLTADSFEIVEYSFNSRKKDNPYSTQVSVPDFMERTNPAQHGR